MIHLGRDLSGLGEEMIGMHQILMPSRVNTLRQNLWGYLLHFRLVEWALSLNPHLAKGLSKSAALQSSSIRYRSWGFVVL